MSMQVHQADKDFIAVQYKRDMHYFHEIEICPLCPLQYTAQINKSTEIEIVSDKNEAKAATEKMF